jgi:hypothetical protein
MFYKDFEREAHKGIFIVDPVKEAKLAPGQFPNRSRARYHGSHTLVQEIALLARGSIFNSVHLLGGTLWK